MLTAPLRMGIERVIPRSRIGISGLLLQCRQKKSAPEITTSTNCSELWILLDSFSLRQAALGNSGHRARGCFFVVVCLFVLVLSFFLIEIELI